MVGMATDKFTEQYHRIEQQFRELRSYEKISTIIELTQTFEITYQHFLVQWLQVNIKNTGNPMYEHTVDQANSPDIVNCLFANSAEKILSALQLFLPLIIIKTMNEKLVKAYREVLMHLDANIHSINYTDFESQIYHPVQQVLFFIQTNSHLKEHLQSLPKLIYLVQTRKFYAEEHQPTLQRHSSTRLPMHQPAFVNPQQLTRLETNDSGVDLTEPTVTNSTQQFFLAQNQQQQQQQHPSFVNIQKKHSFVGKTASSPIPEHATLDTRVHVPLTGVFSAPAPSTHQLDYRSHHQRPVTILTKSDEEEEDNEQSKQSQDFNSKPVTQFYSLRYRNIKTTQSNSEKISQYLGVEGNATSERNSFIQANSGMKEVPAWLKHLRLHKYTLLFSQFTYDEMMNLTMEQLKALGIVDGACKKIIANVEKLKERSSLLKQYLASVENGPVDLGELIKKIEDIVVTPIRSRQLELENHSDENLPKLIIELLEKVYQRVIHSSSHELCSKFLYLIDRCYRIEVFTEAQDQVLLLLQWRRYLTRLAKTLTPTDQSKPTQLMPSYSFQPRRSIKSSVKPMKSSSSIYYPNNITLAKFNSEPQHNNQFLDHHRRVIRSPTSIPPTNEESSDYPHHSTGGYLASHQHQTLTRKPSIDPASEVNSSTRTKLCQTFSDPNRMRLLMTPGHLYNGTQENFTQMQLMAFSQQQKATIPTHVEESQTGIDSFYQEITDKAINDDDEVDKPETLTVSADTVQ